MDVENMVHSDSMSPTSPGKGLRHLHEDHEIVGRDIAQYARARVPPWSRAWGLGCSSRDPAWPSPNERHKAIPQWAHHLQGGVPPPQTFSCKKKLLNHQTQHFTK
ncbi:hypothetical protein ATANTOWER_022802 [Ataeniobius toweri]|uniref:Uncharacterized protein n=1 Tax=Ataeniobius toweri TaxID=208326 RepID=A0ABU7AIK0_9TELE|nr:hypothetical protein [Ataeniobius toweri]